MSAGNAKIGHPAPQFKVTAVVDGQFKDVQLSDYRGTQESNSLVKGLTEDCDLCIAVYLFFLVNIGTCQPLVAWLSVHTMLLTSFSIVACHVCFIPGFYCHPLWQGFEDFVLNRYIFRNHVSWVNDVAICCSFCFTQDFFFSFSLFFLKESMWFCSSILWTSPSCAPLRSSPSAIMSVSSVRLAVRSSLLPLTPISVTWPGEEHLQHTPAIHTHTYGVPFHVLIKQPSTPANVH